MGNYYIVLIQYNYNNYNNKGCDLRDIQWTSIAKK